ncbi:hypothetical protein VUR80DRAFT_896 [Thermomyces stellatus]
MPFWPLTSNGTLGRTCPSPQPTPPFPREGSTVPSHHPQRSNKNRRSSILSVYFEKKILSTSVHYGGRDPPVPNRDVSDGGRHNTCDPHERRQGWPGPLWLCAPGTAVPLVTLRASAAGSGFLGLCLFARLIFWYWRLVYYESGPIPWSASTSPLILAFTHLHHAHSHISLQPFIFLDPDINRSYGTLKLS